MPGKHAVFQLWARPVLLAATALWLDLRGNQTPGVAADYPAAAVFA
jgi:hypothetical protein